MSAQHRRFLGVATAVGLVGLAACTDSNAFAGGFIGGGGGGAGGAPVVDIENPRGDSLTARPLGDSVRVEARVRDESGIVKVDFLGVSIRGDAELGTQEVVQRFFTKSVTLDGVRDTTLTRFLQPTPDTTKEATKIIVRAFDGDGNESADTTTITLGGPGIELLNLEDGQSVQAGLALSLQARATDPQGILQVSFEVSGAFTDTLSQSFNPPPDSVQVDTVLTIPAGVTGQIEVVAKARNSLDVAGQDGPVRLNVTTGGVTDTSPPSLSFVVDTPDRLETRDSIRVEVSSSDDSQGSGIQRVGATVAVFSPSRGVTETQTFDVVFPQARTGRVSQTVPFAPFNIQPEELPDTLVFEITAFSIDASGNCSAAVTQDQEQSFECVLSGADVQAQGRTGARLTRSVVAGRTVTLPAGGRIMDAAVDTVRRNLLLSNIERDRIEVFRLQAEQFLGFVPVGSQPWGVALNRDGDTLVVANSGGTNFSRVFLGARDPDTGGSAAEVPGARFLTPDVLLFDVQRTEDDDGLTRFNVFHVPDVQSPSFTDRPQFVVQDFTGRLLYSTKTNPVGDMGTIRRAFVPPGGEFPEVTLFWEHGALIPAEDFTGIANADDVSAVREDFGDQVVVTDHVPGFPDQIITGGPAFPAEAVADLQAQGSDAVAVAGRFSVTNIGFTDTTFVGISGDRHWAVFGEGTIDVGRVIMYDATNDVISGVVPVSDLITNAAESVRGIGLNYDGSLGVARGDDAYFFTNDLRLEGSRPLPAGGAGAALHPLHANALTFANPGGEYRPDTHLAFVGTGERTVDIIDTFHFFRSGRLFLRDVPSGPIRAVLPFPGDNAGNQCVFIPVTAPNPETGVLEQIGQTVEIFANGDFESPHPPNGPSEDRCVVLKLFGVTDTGGVVVIDVRKADILRNHPSRD